ncbi:ABC transporter substrate-binding protein [Shinella yambaruensis]|uniref:ABC transporter substrate-binding protein n=1 Tax=Shinella yambaruensis TaxID=415996 RepID=A0ABQ5ZI01_9HYPH|nr:ABC transporter substrate-binding protein [Shinella yambaruensis]MCJ8027363.1 ABC transporter substrate-binding protein [Shinella yambaruensis]MCU7983246.1 ABC transporter substrate-binding protein [Shinella yambaruensis]GLR52420.1 ABC transporter substrate-binding protein [Shinella yambaruensis]
MPKTLICLFTTASVLAMGLTGAIAQEAKEIGIPDSDYSLEALIEAARKEEPITVIDATGKIVTMAENFSAKYGLKATGVKMSGQDQEQVIAREAAAGNVRTDVFNMSNLPSVTSQILPQGFGISWLAPDLKDKIPAAYQSPAITSNNPWVFAYNTDVNGETCPVDNLWALTTEEWKGRVAIPDPLLRNETMFWFNQLATHEDAAMREAYKAQFGEELTTDEASATAEWVKRLAKNQSKVTRSDTDVGPIVGAKEEKPPIGFLSAAIFRDAKKDGYGMGICKEMKPWIGQLTPRVAVIAAGTKSPNTAKLFARFMMTEEGMAPQLGDGKISTNTEAKMPESEVSGIANHVDKLYVNHSETSQDDFAKLQDWQDFWLQHSR